MLLNEKINHYLETKHLKKIFEVRYPRKENKDVHLEQSQEVHHEGWQLGQVLADHQA